MTKITENLQLLRQRIQAAAEAAGRDPQDIRLLAVSKKHPVAAIHEAYAAGQRDFGENYVQEALAKIAALDETDIRWHFIGALQSNKTEEVATHFDWLHTLSREKIARRLNDQRPAQLRPLQVCIQVRIGDELSKSGVKKEDVERLAGAIAKLPRLALRGLMCLPPWSEDPATQRRYFSELRDCFASLCSAGHDLDTLSMGMTGDLESAVAEGSTCLRVGTAIFGPREQG